MGRSNNQHKQQRRVRKLVNIVEQNGNASVKNHTATHGGVQIASDMPVVMAVSTPASLNPVQQKNHRAHGNPCKTHDGDWCPTVSPVDLDVVTLMSGRLYAFDKYIAGLRSLDYPKDRLHLLWYTNSDNPAYLCLASSTALQLSREWYDVRLICDPSIRPTRHALREIQPEDGAALDHCDVIANLYNRALSMTSRDVFFLEDDIVPEPAALRRLLAILERHRKCGYACAAVTDRHSPRKFIWRLIVNPDGTRGGIELTQAEMKGTKHIGMGGLACVVMRRWAIDAISHPIMKMYPPSSFPPSLLGGCDIVLCYEMEQLGIERIADFGIRSTHLRSDGVGV